MGFSLVKGKTALSGKSRFFDKAGQKIIRQVPEIGRVLWQISAGCAANRHLELEVATTSRAGAMADDNATPGRPKHKKTTRTPRRKEVLRAEKFYAYEWDKLRVNLLRGFLLAVCDQDGYKYEPEDVVKLNVAEALTEVEGFASEVDVNFPWAVDIEEFLEIGDNKAALGFGAEDEKQLEEVKVFFDKKVEEERKAVAAQLAKASPNTRSKAIRLRPAAPVPEEIVDDISTPAQAGTTRPASPQVANVARRLNYSEEELERVRTEAAAAATRAAEKESSKLLKALERKRKADADDAAAAHAAELTEAKDKLNKLKAVHLAQGKHKSGPEHKKKKKKSTKKDDSDDDDDSDDSDSDSDSSDTDGSDTDDSSDSDSSSNSSDSDRKSAKKKHSKRRKTGRKSSSSRTPRMSKLESKIEQRASASVRLEEVYNSVHGEDLDKAETIAGLFMGLVEKFSLDGLTDRKSRKKPRRYQTHLSYTHRNCQKAFADSVSPIEYNTGAVAQVEKLFVIKMRALLRKQGKIVRLLKLDEAYNKAIEKVVEPFVSGKISAGQSRSQQLPAALQLMQPQVGGPLRRENKSWNRAQQGPQLSPQGLRLTRDGRPIRCFRCDGNHYQSDCPLPAQPGEQQNGRAAAGSSAPVGAAMPPPPGLPQFKAVP